MIYSEQKRVPAGRVWPRERSPAALVVVGRSSVQAARTHARTHSHHVSRR
jgi:hypothetical protein